MVCAWFAFDICFKNINLFRPVMGNIWHMILGKPYEREDINCEQMFMLRESCSFKVRSLGDALVLCVSLDF